jgi:hypothetical protein
MLLATSPSGLSAVSAGGFSGAERAHGGSNSNSSSALQLLSQSQVTGSLLGGITPSTSYTGETSYSSYTVYSSRPSSRLLSGGSVSLQPSELSGWSGVGEQQLVAEEDVGVQGQQRLQQKGVDLAGALASVKAAGLLAHSSSSDPTPRLASG